MQPAATQKWRRPFIGAQWLFLRRGPGATNHFEGGGFVRSERRRRLPEPDVPLPADRDPLRRHGRREGPRLPGPRRADVLRRPRLRARSPRRTRASAPGDPLQLPLDRPGPARVGRGDPGRPADPRPAGVRASTTAARSSPGPSVETDDEILAWVARDAETALHPSCTARMGTDAAVGRRPADDAASTASTGCGSSTRRAMPYVTNGNIYAPVMMLAEKAADLIVGNDAAPARADRRSTATTPRRRVSRPRAPRSADRGQAAR